MSKKFENEPYGPARSGFATVPGFDPTDFKPNTAKGQHILLDQEAISMAGQLVPEGSHVIEIGAGPGTLTVSLLERAGSVSAYEVDDRCKPILDHLTKDGKLNVKWQNFLEASNEDIEAISPFHIFGNIPFHISEPLLVKLTDIRFQSAVLLVGQNLVKSMTTANPDSGSWSRLSMITAAFFNVEKILTVSRGSFDPPPRVDAGLIRITRIDDSPNWRSDAVVRSYRSLIEARTTNSTVAKALKSVIVTPNGDAEASSANKRTDNRRTERRLARMALTSLTADYNLGNVSGRDAGNSTHTSQDMHSIVSKTVDARLLSKPLSGLTNNELAKICGAITTAVNRRKKTR